MGLFSKKQTKQSKSRFDKFFNFINENLRLLTDVSFPKVVNGKVIQVKEKNAYGYKNYDTETERIFYEMCDKKGYKWKFENKILLQYKDGYEKRELEKLIADYSKIRGNNGKQPVPFPNAYKEFMLVMNGGHFIGFSIDGYPNKVERNTPTVGITSTDAGALGLVIMTNNTRPDCIDKNLLKIGHYGSDKADIYINQAGNIFVYGKESYKELNKLKPPKGFRGENDDPFDSPEFLERTNKVFSALQVPLLAYWDNFEDFLIQETDRLLELYTKDPTCIISSAPLPNNLKNNT